MSSVAYLAETLGHILEEEACLLARETGFIQRERRLSGADFAQTLIFGWLAEPEISLDGLVQVAGRREVKMSASALHQRFSPAAATFLQRILERLTHVHLQTEAVPVALLKQFSAVIVEDSTRIHLPHELAELWRGGGGSQNTSQATLKLFVRWNMLSGEVQGPLLTDGKQSDAKSPFKEQAIPAEGLYLGDLGFFEQGRLRAWHRRGADGKRRYYLMRLPMGTALYSRNGHRLVLRGLLPQHEGDLVELGVLVGSQARVPARLILQRVPEEVAEQRRLRLREEARDRGRPPSEEALYLAGWSIVVTNVPRRLLSLHEVLVVLTVRWQIELLFRLWKEGGQIDEWHSCKGWRIVCEIYAKLAAMVLQQWLIQLGCWHETHRSLVKAAQVVRREAGQLMVAIYEGRVEQGIQQIMRCMRSGCCIEKRSQFPSTLQRLEGVPMPSKRPPRPKSSRHRDQLRRWPAGKGWATSKLIKKAQARVALLT